MPSFSHYSLSIYLIKFLGLNQLSGFYLGCGKVFTILEKTHILKSIQEAHGLKALNLVKATITRRFSHGAAYSNNIIVEALYDITTTSSNPELVACRDNLL